MPLSWSRWSKSHQNRLRAQKRNDALQEVGAYTQVDWYAMYPHMYVGDAHFGTSEKGKTIVDYEIKALIELIQGVKADKVTARVWWKNLINDKTIQNLRISGQQMPDEQIRKN